MINKKKSTTTATMVLITASLFILAALPLGVSYGDDPPDVIIHVGQEYEYTPVFNIKEVDVEAKTLQDTIIDITKDGTTDGTITIEGLAVGTGTVTVTGTSKHVSTNTSVQTFTVEVIAALTITTTEFTFYKDAAGSEKQVESSNDPDVVYSAQGLPDGLHMDASSTGLIYGKATTIGSHTGATAVEITATNLKTGMTIKTGITIHVVASGSEFEITADDNVFEATGEDRYFVENDVATFVFASDEIGGTWSVKASEAFADAAEYNIDTTSKKLTFTPTGSDFSELSGDYAVYIYHTDKGVTTVKYIVIHFQAVLGFDTSPVASFVADYTGSGLEVVGTV